MPLDMGKAVRIGESIEEAQKDWAITCHYFRLHAELCDARLFDEADDAGKDCVQALEKSLRMFKRAHRLLADIQLTA